MRRQAINRIKLLDVYSRSADGQALDVNSFGDCSQLIPLGICTNQTGTVDLRFEGLENFLPEYDVFLIDAQNSRAKINLRTTPEYSFDKTSPDEFIDGKLFLSVRKTVDESQGASVAIFAREGKLQVISSDDISRVEVIDMQGKILLRKADIESPVYTCDLPQSGIYVVKVSTGRGTVVKKLTNGN
jgi:hypothetical protein